MFKIRKALYHFFLITVLLSSLQMVYGQSETAIKLKWEVANVASKDDTPSKFYKAKVPGAVQYDYMHGNKMEDFSIGVNVEDYKHLEDDYWVYRTNFKNPLIDASQQVVFYSAGIDYEFEIHLNDELLTHQEGMFTPVRLVLNEKLQDKNELKIIIYPIPIAEGQVEGRSQAILAVKPPVPYGWDWHPRLIPSGIWDDTGIMIENQAQIVSTDFIYQLSDQLDVAEINFSFQVTAASVGLSYNWKLTDANGNEVQSQSGSISDLGESFNSIFKNPELWWSHDHGNPTQYVSTLTLKNGGQITDEQTQKVGFRKVELVMNEGAWKEPQGFPKGRSIAPFTMKLNNRVVFAKGSNWVHPEIFYGLIDYDRYLEQLVLVKEMNMNMLRVWGGGITNKESFFQICDSLGIMVWQEFPLACNLYPNNVHYLEILEKEGTSIIKRVRQHPSFAIWSGGNELFNSWGGMTEQSYPLRLLNSLCYRIDPHTPFINTAPIFGVGHGHYIFYDPKDNMDVFQRMNKARFSAYTEFGMPSLAPKETLEKVIPKEELFPPSPTPSWVKHHAYKAWHENSWMEINTIEKYFGKANSLDELVWQSQILQSVGYKAIFEEGRRQKPYCSMTLNWCLNEPWPTAANNSILAYPNIKKPSFEAVKESLRPQMASAKFPRFDVTAGNHLEFDLWILNDAYKPIDPGHIDVYITLDGDKIKIGNWDFPTYWENRNIQGPRIRHYLKGNTNGQLAKISVEVAGRPDMNSSYYVLIRSFHKAPVNVNRLNFN